MATRLSQSPCSISICSVPCPIGNLRESDGPAGGFFRRQATPAMPPPDPTVVRVTTDHHKPSSTDLKTSGCAPCSRWYMPRPTVTTITPVPVNSAPASSLAKLNALASLATAVLRPAIFAVERISRNRRNARSAFRSNPVNSPFPPSERTSRNRRARGESLPPGAADPHR